MPQITNPKNDRRSLTHTFNEVGSANGTLAQNTASVNSPVVQWDCPRKYRYIQYAGGRHKTKFVPRYKESITGTAGDDTSVTLTGDIQPISGETDLADQPYPSVEAYNVTQDTEIAISGIDYSTNTITLATNPADGDNVAIFPVLCEGTLQYRALDQFGHEVAPLDEWSTPVHVFADFEQDKNETEVHLIGAAQWSEAETLALYVNSPRQIVWQDAEYLGGQYASTIEQRVDVTV